MSLASAQVLQRERRQGHVRQHVPAWRQRGVDGEVAERRARKRLAAALAPEHREFGEFDGEEKRAEISPRASSPHRTRASASSALPERFALASVERARARVAEDADAVGRVLPTRLRVLLTRLHTSRDARDAPPGSAEAGSAPGALAFAATHRRSS